MLAPLAKVLLGDHVDMIFLGRLCLLRTMENMSINIYISRQSLFIDAPPYLHSYPGRTQTPAIFGPKPKTGEIVQSTHASIGYFFSSPQSVDFLNTRARDFFSKALL